MDALIRTKSFEIDRKAYHRAMWAYGLPRRLAIVAGLIVVIALIEWVTAGLWALLGALLGSVVILPFAVLARFLFARRNVWSPEMRLALAEPRTMAFSYDSVYLKTQSGVESRVPWTEIQRTLQRGGFTLLFISKRQHLIVPRSEFSTEGDRDTFDALLRGKGLVKAISGRPS